MKFHTYREGFNARQAHAINYPTRCINDDRFPLMSMKWGGWTDGKDTAYAESH